MSTAQQLPELVIYHANCDDGFCAAWLHSRYGRRMGEYVAAQYGDDPPDVAGRDVLIFDFSYPREVLLKMHEEANSLLVFDHHKTAEAALAGLDFCTFDMDKSGARLAQEYLASLFPETEDRACIQPGDVLINWLVNYVEDRDMWRFSLPDSKAVTAGLRTYPREFAVWDQIYAVGPDALVREGRSILRYQEQMIAAAMSKDNTGRILIGGHLVPCVNNTLPSITSELVGKLAEGEGVPFAVGFFILPGDKVVYNLRSRGEVDVSEIAKLYGGGGHPKAAGFSVSVDTMFPLDPQS